MPTLRSEVRVVVLDVVVSTGKGQPVPGLSKDDFEVIEDGKPQKLVSFEEHKGEAVVQQQLPPMPPNVFTNYPTIAPPDSVNVLLLDWLNTQPQDQASVHAQIIKYLKQVPPGTRMAIFTLAPRLHMVHGFTDDLSALVATLAANKSGAGSRTSPLLPTAVQKSAESDLVSLMIMNQAAPAAIEAVRQEMSVKSASDTSTRIALTLEGLQQLARFLSAIPGRKNVIWFAGSFPVNFLPDGGVQRQFQGDIQRTANMLTPDRVALYPVSAEGLATDANYIGTYERGRPPARDDMQPRAANQFAMEQLAHSTGGRAFYGTNGLGATMAQIINDDTRFYTLAYTPSNKKRDGAYRNVQVKIRDGGYKLTYRRGYYAEDDRKQRQAAERPLSGDPLLSLMTFGLPDFSQILYKTRVLAVDHRAQEGAADGGDAQRKGPLTRYGVDFAISLNDLKLEKTPDGVRHANVELMLIAYDRDGHPLGLATQKGELRLTPKQYEEARRVGLQLHKEIDAEQGDSYLRTGIYDFNSGKAGTLGMPLNALSAPIPH